MGPTTSETAAMEALKQRCAGLAQANVDLGLLQETNITGEFYVRDSSGFHVVVSDATSCYGRGVELFYKHLTRFVVEAHQQHGLNINIFQMMI